VSPPKCGVIENFNYCLVLNLKLVLNYNFSLRGWGYFSLKIILFKIIIKKFKYNLSKNSLTKQG